MKGVETTSTSRQWCRPSRKASERDSSGQVKNTIVEGLKKNVAGEAPTHRLHPSDTLPGLVVEHSNGSEGVRWVAHVRGFHKLEQSVPQ